MQTEIVVLIVTSIITLVTVVANIIVTAIIAGKQNKIELKKTRIEVLVARRTQLERVKAEISSRMVNVTGIKSKDMSELLPRIVNFYQQNSSSLFTVGHYLPSDFVSEAEELTKRIDQYILNDKTGQPSDILQKESDINSISKMDARIRMELSVALRKIETDIELLMK